MFAKLRNLMSVMRLLWKFLICGWTKIVIYVTEHPHVGALL